MCDHVGKECIAGDVERHPEAHVTRALVQLTRQLAVTHVELAQGVAGRQSHERQVCSGKVTRYRMRMTEKSFKVNRSKQQSLIKTFRVPRAHDDPSVLWILFDRVDDLLQLIDSLSCVICGEKLFKNKKVVV